MSLTFLQITSKLFRNIESSLKFGSLLCQSNICITLSSIFRFSLFIHELKILSFVLGVCESFTAADSERNFLLRFPDPRGSMWGQAPEVSPHAAPVYGSPSARGSCCCGKWGWRGRMAGTVDQEWCAGVCIVSLGCRN